MEKTKGRPSEGVAGPPTKKSKGATDETEKLDEAEKPKGAMDNFVVQHQSTRKACEYLLAHAPVTQPVGYKHLRSAIDKAKEEIEGALDRNDFERAAKLEAAEVKMRNAAELEEVLLQKAIACQQYQSLFTDPGGDYYDLRQIYRLARIFNPRIANGLDVNTIEEAIDELHRFKMPEFTAAFRENMKKEIAAYKAELNATALRNGTDNDFWSSVPGAKEYDESLAAKNSKSPALPDKTWLDDPIEKARRLWEWWRANHNKFTYFSKAARLVVLVQTSSCAVERVFSQVKYILETVGDLVLEESLEARLMERINCGKY